MCSITYVALGFDIACFFGFGLNLCGAYEFNNFLLWYGVANNLAANPSQQAQILVESFLWLPADLLH
jgi:hypothetical protein